MQYIIIKNNEGGTGSRLGTGSQPSVADLLEVVQETQCSPCVVIRPQVSVMTAVVFIMLVQYVV